ncbi:MAG: class I SAM-dependent methyltransferase [Actinomycetota bacterium]|nr:class I SAM-dependent methyltransferase [Actinomycetota bacterium]
MSHYFDEQPAPRSDRRAVDLDLGDVRFTLFTDHGVFSHGTLDTGTRLLLERAPPAPTHGELADIGCGTGAIALAMALRSPAATVWAIDVNERARDLTKANAEHNGVGNIHVVGPGDVPPDVRFDVIWSNPPIRIGKPALHQLLITWLSRLNPDGMATLVVQRNLGADSLHRWLEASGWPTDRLSSSKGFRVLQVTSRS